MTDGDPDADLEIRLNRLAAELESRIGQSFDLQAGLRDVTHETAHADAPPLSSPEPQLAGATDANAAPVPVDIRLWGKEQGLPRPYPLICHLLDTSAMAGALYDQVLGDQRGAWLAAVSGVEPEQMRGLTMYWAGLHDIGKISPPFQAKIARQFAELRSDRRYLADPVGKEAMRFHHSHATQYLLAELFTASGYPAGSSPKRPYTHVAHQIAQMLGGHHGTFHERLSQSEFAEPRSSGRTLGAGEWERQVEAHAESLAKLIGAGAEARPGGVLPVAAIAVLTGLVVCADWLASQESYILHDSRLPTPAWSGAPEELREHWAAAVAAAPGEIAAAGLGRVRFTQVAPGAAGFRERFPEITSPNPLQSSLASLLPEIARGPGLLLVTAPTGDGKTEAAQWSAVHLAEVCGCGGLAFALPTQATADAMFRRINRFARQNLAEDASLALVHGTAWLSTDYEALAGRSAAGTRILTGRGAPLANNWLRGSGLGVHAALGAITIDRLLFGVLPVKHNMFWLYALSGKVVVIDEAHGYGPWMHSLLLKLLEWLGAMQVPVVLMSATLASATAASLLQAYRRGCGHPPLPEPPPAVPYPGWIFLDATSGQYSAPISTGTARPRHLEFVIEPVRRGVSAAQISLGARERLTVLTQLLTPLRESEGCVLVCCNTVAEAQDTYDHLAAQFGDIADVSILHPRFTGADRARITTRSESAFGRSAPDSVTSRRPIRAIMIATQIVEQSVDLDFDLVVSDLAPIAQLLQRAGRCRRHERGTRPQWTGSEKLTRVIVLDPVDEHGAFARPPQWDQVYFEALLLKTRRELAALAGAPIEVPAGVRELVDAVDTDTFTEHGAHLEDAQLAAAEREQWARNSAEEHLAGRVGIAYPHDPVDLAVLNGADSIGLVDESIATTRFGADSARIVLMYRTADGELALHGEDEPAPCATTGYAFTREQILRVMRCTAPAPGWWLRANAEECRRPAGWDENPLLRNLIPIEGHITAGGSWRSTQGNVLLSYDGAGGGLRRMGS